jgi:hypothetical protein
VCVCVCVCVHDDKLKSPDPEITNCPSALFCVFVCLHVLVCVCD